MEFITVGNLVDCLEAEFIGRAIGSPRFYSTAGKPSGKTSPIMISPLSGIALSGRLTSKFGGANNQCVLKHTTGF